MSITKILTTKPPGYVVATVAISLAGWLQGHDTGSVGAVTVMPYYIKTFGNLSPIVRGLTVSIIMLTGALPCLYAGQLSNHYGRLRTIMFGAILFCIGAIMQAAASKLGVFIAGRAICGLGLGTWLSNLYVYTAEIAPSARRGTLMATPQLATCLGIMTGHFNAYGSVKIESDMSWRVVYILQAIVALAIAGICLVLPESPRWELLRGRRDRAIHQLKRLDFGQAEAEKDLLGPAAQREIVAQPGPIEGLVMIFRRPYRSRTTLALVYLGMCQLSGIDGVLYYAPTLFAQAGLPETTSSFVASGVSAILMLAITVPALIYVDRYNRRVVTLTGGLILTACMFLIGSLYAADAVSPTSAARYVVVALVFIFALAYSSTWAVVGKLYSSEIQPAATRSAANSVAQGTGFLTNWFVAMITPILLASSSSSAYFLFGGFCIISVIGLWLYMPETRGQSLEAIEAAFAAPVTGGSQAARIIRKWFGRRSVVHSSGSSTTSQDATTAPSTPGTDNIELASALSMPEGVHSNTSARAVRSLEII